MARIRTIRPSFFHDEQIAELSPACRLFLIGLWSIADQNGMVEYRPRRIKHELFPYDPVDPEAIIGALEEAGLVSVSSDVIHIANWLYWQPDARREPRGNEARLWRKAVLARDGYACQGCGSDEGLEAHHIKPWALFPGDRFDLDNGIALCTECHKVVHREAGAT